MVIASVSKIPLLTTDVPGSLESKISQSLNIVHVVAEADTKEDSQNRQGISDLAEGCTV